MMGCSVHVLENQNLTQVFHSAWKLISGLLNSYLV